MSALFTPDDFAGDWYGWLANQSGHVLLGLVAVIIATAAAGGDVDRGVLLGGVSIGYIVYEIGWQGWRRWDTIEDTIFVCGYGAGAVLTVFHANEPWVVTGDIRGFLPFLAVMVPHLLVGCLLRMWRAGEWPWQK